MFDRGDARLLARIAVLMGALTLLVLWTAAVLGLAVRTVQVVAGG